MLFDGFLFGNLLSDSGRSSKKEGEPKENSGYFFLRALEFDTPRLGVLSFKKSSTLPLPFESQLHEFRGGDPLFT